MGKNKNKQKKKQKPVYIDDGSSVANLSGVGRPHAPRLGEFRPGASFREQFKTYTDAVKLMFLPMLAVLGILALAFLIVYILL
jgi:hypothetical protein